MVELLLLPFVAGLVLTGIHAYFGFHVLARGIIFVDLSLAQVAALGIAIAILAGHTVQSPAAYWYALTFAIGGATLFSLARRYEKLIPQEAVIGIVYAVCAAMGVIALDRAPQGAEHIKQVLIGSILAVDKQDVQNLALLYASIGLIHWLLRKPLIKASFGHDANLKNSRFAFWWDIFFYGSFALVVTSSVRIAGVLLVFSYLIVPAAIAGLFATSMRNRLLIAWVLGALITGIGLCASWVWDLPTGPAIVTAFGAATALVAIIYWLKHLTLLLFGQILAGVFIVAGLLLVAFPKMDQPWLDAFETAVPQAHEFFFTSDEIEMRLETEETIKSADDELTRLRALEQSVRWGETDMPLEKQERLRQYLAARGEIQAGDQIVLRELRVEVRERQRYGLGIPMLLSGVTLLMITFWRKKKIRLPPGLPPHR